MNHAKSIEITKWREGGWGPFSKWIHFISGARGDSLEEMAGSKLRSIQTVAS